MLRSFAVAQRAGTAEQWAVGLFMPTGRPLEAFQKTRDAIEQQVMALILQLRWG